MLKLRVRTLPPVPPAHWWGLNHLAASGVRKIVVIPTIDLSHFSEFPGEKNVSSCNARDLD
jgi:hypothetical protein